MSEQREIRQEKNPVGAAVLSAIFPGLGMFYVGNAMKAIAYIVIFACLIVLQVKGRVAHEHVVVGLLIAGFYIFQIFDSFEEARKTTYRYRHGDRQVEEPEMGTSLFAGLLILGIGVVFQLAELDIIRYHDILRLWPVVLIAVGAKFIYTFMREDKKRSGNSEDQIPEENHE